MAKRSIEKETDDFDEMLEKRQRMFKTQGIKLSAYSYSKVETELFPQSVVNCYSCENKDICGAWLDANSFADSPPAFCLNHDLIGVLKADKKQRPNSLSHSVRPLPLAVCVEPRCVLLSRMR